ncbi:MAG: sugar ABC transporter ATP-binding protein [Rhodopila sp.]
MSDAAPPTSPNETAPPPVLALETIGKRYGVTVALQDVSLTLQRGEICGLLGENGAGKSTLVKVLSGVVTPDTGTMHVAGVPYCPRTILDARAHGVATAFQELSLVPALSVAVNLFLPQPGINRLGMVARRRIEQEAAAILAAHGVRDIPPATLVGDLSLGMRQRVEIVRALWRQPRILLLDEPTAALADRDWLFGQVAAAVGRGASILYISHKLDEVRRLCRRCVILRNGRKVRDAEVAAMSDDEIFGSMAGRSVVETFVSAPPAIRPGPPALRATGLRAPGVDDVSFTLAPGEILGVAGLEGQGQSRLFQSLVGLHRLQSGRIEVLGKPVALHSPRAARRAGVVLVPEERKTEGIFKDLTTTANISLPVIARAARLRLISRRAERRLVEQVTPAVDLPPRYLKLPITALSGGNQQKTVLARALITGARCLLLFDPTRGVDVGAKQSIYRMIQQFAASGGAVLFYSTELDELVHLCDRCLVIYRNRIAGDLPRDLLSQERILSIASGHGAAPPIEGAAMALGGYGRPQTDQAVPLREGQPPASSWPGSSGPTIAARAGGDGPDEPGHDGKGTADTSQTDRGLL